MGEGIWTINGFEFVGTRSSAKKNSLLEYRVKCEETFELAECRHRRDGEEAEGRS
jgi:hypothetical protein